MGVLRLLLALSVLFSHGEVSEFYIFSGNFAVEVFFAVSGFYMAMVLQSRYDLSKDFYLSRLWRLFPTYLLVVAMSAFLLNFLGKNDWNLLSGEAYILALFSNITLLFQDVSLFLQLLPSPEGLILSWTHDFTQSDTPFFKYMLIPTAWSLSMEIYFYLLVPFLTKLSNKMLYAILLGSAFLRVVGFLTGFNEGGWVFRFFPFEIMFFIMGIFLYRKRTFFIRIVDNVFPKRAALLLLWGICLGITLYGGGLDQLLFHRASYIFVGLFIVLVPFLFELTKRNRYDRFIGDLSYPVYLVHPLFYTYLHYSALETLTCTLVISVLIVLLLEKPVDRFRHKLYVHTK